MNPEPEHLENLGLFVFGIVFFSMFLISVAAVIPWHPRVALVYFGSVVGLAGAVIATLWIAGRLFGVLMS